MAEHSFYTFLLGRKALQCEAWIQFSHWYPENNYHWQDKALGSIALITAYFCHTPNAPLDIIDQIKARHACWSYLQTHILSKNTTLRSLYWQSPKVIPNILCE